MDTTETRYDRLPHGDVVFMIDEYNRYLSEYLIDLPTEHAKDIMVLWAEIRASYRFDLLDDTGLLSLWDKLRKNEVLFDCVEYLKQRLWLGFGTQMTKYTEVVCIACAMPMDNQFVDSEYAKVVITHQELAKCAKSNQWLLVLMLLKYIPGRTFRFVQIAEG